MSKRLTVPHWLLLAIVGLGLLTACSRPADEIVIGSKKFTEGIILGEVLRGLVADAGIPVRHRRALGGTRIVFNALVNGEIDAYVDYTGTLLHEILPEQETERKSGQMPGQKSAQEPGQDQTLQDRLATLGIRMAGSLGFQNNYALGMPEARAQSLGIARISDLLDHPELKFRFGNEFMDRADGWAGLRSFYGLPQTDVRSLEHELAYRALASGDADLTDLYTTDAEIPYYNLRPLRDDRDWFTHYDAVLLYRADLLKRSPEAVAALERSLGLIDASEMRAMNAAVQLEGRSESQVASNMLRERIEIVADVRTSGLVSRVAQRTLEHVTLVGVSLFAAIVVAIPLGLVAAHRPRLGQLVLAGVGIAQTIPALALLVLMIPFFGIGAGPALVALFLYSLLPIVRNTHAGISGIPSAMIESADALGLPPGARLRRIELPLALPTILAGIKTAAVINVGAATLGALIGAGGYGQPILAGIRLDDLGLILEGALPAAVLAVTVQWLFEQAERATLPRGIRGLGREGGR
ncbi:MULTISPECIES: ABC transporter permease/substrate-binding protein [Thiorhodovibrio]|uniref:ABC transporter permease/substrate-binding protein n=1 Tax=Thiorhodovibrio TaxID=61593 RepID=UPI0019147A4B|nr:MULTISPECIES: glycine betaine ABC transporter substrate-binding protein [Thiorhodovibrio]MBK5968624.1 amino acid ABC transporter permease [Thiorhodovibrio winogradskyi]WPL11272.1 Glycine betaine/carnitine/choline transport system permease protein OpuCB [Thiorhodovibrio litoralis]